MLAGGVPFRLQTLLPKKKTNNHATAGLARHAGKLRGRAAAAGGTAGAVFGGGGARRAARAGRPAAGPVPRVVRGRRRGGGGRLPARGRAPGGPRRAGTPAPGLGTPLYGAGRVVPSCDSLRCASCLWPGGCIAADLLMLALTLTGLQADAFVVFASRQPPPPPGKQPMAGWWQSWHCRVNMGQLADPPPRSSTLSAHSTWFPVR